MRLYNCVCDNKIFFDNTRCVTCNREVGWCPACRAMRALMPEGELHYRCSESSCDSLLVKCINYEQEQVCNRCVRSDGVNAAGSLCDYCRFNTIIPDLSVPGNREKWARIEAAKRRLFYVLDLLGLPYGTVEEGFDPPLSFDFKGDEIPESGIWDTMGDEERVYTGHSAGKITINIREADDVEREKLRVDLDEAKRTMIGHFRHEIAHYYWELLVRGRCEEEFISLFGDYDNPPYADALERYYRKGPSGNWRENHVSEYATMHPWEDWAESFALYLDIVSILETAINTGLITSVEWRDIDSMLGHFSHIGIVVNELNRTMGLKDLVPEVITPGVKSKLRFVHDVVCKSGTLFKQAPDPA